MFIRKLNGFRGVHKCLLQSRDNYQNLSQMMLILLDEAHKQMDVQSALKALVFSNNFYLENKEAG
jgi:predicted AAA+ superfamily ATPase